MYHFDYCNDFHIPILDMDAQDGFEQRRAKSVDQMRNLLTQYAVVDQSNDAGGRESTFVRWFSFKVPLH